ncbi:hypothetical protein MXB_2367 [Myxobolus squamalis]|nr:hypothetical protein MXB_2367 [Myxobolus squamalis]
MMDKNTGRPRGFAFVGFESVESSEYTAQIQYHTIKGKRVEVKVAQPRDTKCLDGNGFDLSVTLDDGIPIDGDTCYDLPIEQSSNFQPGI